MNTEYVNIDAIDRAVINTYSYAINTRDLAANTLYTPPRYGVASNTELQNQIYTLQSQLYQAVNQRNELEKRVAELEEVVRLIVEDKIASEVDIKK